MKFVFVHIPRTAGTTFKKMLRSIGYGGKPDHSEIRNIKSAKPFRYFDVSKRKLIHGHFPVSKYYNKFSDSHKFITVVRDPVDRLLSQYNWYIERKPRSNCIVNIQVRRGISSGQIDIVEFSKLMRGLYRDMLGNDLSIYDWIGIQEDFDNSLKRFEDIFGIEIPEEYTTWNVTKRDKTLSDEQIWKIEDMLKPDYVVYNEILRLTGGYNGKN